MKKGLGSERPTLDLMEEAVHLLRSTPLSDFAWYLCGVLPFLLTLLYFWMDMSWNAVAFEHRAEASLGVALLFVWMKCAQAIFARKLRARLAREATERTTWRLVMRVALFQAIIQPSKLFLLPAAALATIPFAWVAAFYENTTVLGEETGTRKLISKSWRLAAFWPRQNHGVLSIYLLLLFLVFLNTGICVFLLPQLLKMFAGAETIFTRGGASMFNSTFFAIVAALTYLICDPLLKATYALRCFYSEAQRSGADLAAEMRSLSRLPAMAAIVIAILLLSLSGGVAAPPPAQTPLTPPASELNRAIDGTVIRPEFSWKLPRQNETVKPARKWPFADAIGRFLKATGRVFKRTMKAITEWFDRLFGPSSLPLPDKPGSAGWLTSSRGVMVALIVVLALAAAALIMQAWRQIRLRRSPAAATAPLASKVDLESEHATADLLPEEEWLALAHGHLGKGELRLALRAFFFAGLAHLAAREVLLLARHKSNRDYQTELRRKASDQPPLLEAFAQNIATVERVWYGRHEINPEGLQGFENNLEKIRAC